MESYKYQRLGLAVLGRALDDICPTYDNETEEERIIKIRDRISVFKEYERDIDREWAEMVEEFSQELKNLTNERDIVFNKISKTNNSERVAKKIADFERKKSERVNYLLRKEEREVSDVETKLGLYKEGSKKHNQLSKKLEKIKATTLEKIKSTELRYNTIIKNTMNSDNSERVSQRLHHSKNVWQRRLNELENSYKLREDVHHNKRMEFDQIRMALEAFLYERKWVAHWCEIAQVPLKDCYEEVKRRLELIERDTTEIDKILEEIKEGKYEEGSN